MRVPHQDSYEENLRHIESEFSGISEIIAGIRKVAAASRSFDLPEFPEPKTWIFQENGGDAKVAMDADLVAAWIVHMSHSTRLRMELLEDAVIRSIANSELLVSATLARAHMEAAAWAAYANEELIKASDSGSWEKIEKLMPAMLYGSAVAAEKKNLPEDAVLTPLVKPSSIMNAIDALDRFYSSVTGEKGKSSRVLYAILSDYAHPSISGVRHLYEATSESNDSWTIQYSRSESLDAADVLMVLDTLFRNMRLGYGSALLMRLGVLEETTTGLRYEKPTLENGAGIWEHIMLGASV